MCQRNECRSKSECIVCVPRRLQSNLSSAGAASVTISKPDFEFGRPDSPSIENPINISQQILPVNQLKVNIPSRDRSRSETELNIFTNTKLNVIHSFQNLLAVPIICELMKNFEF